MTQPNAMAASAERVAEICTHARTTLFALLALCTYVLLAVYQESRSSAERLQLKAEMRASDGEIASAKERLGIATKAFDDVSNKLQEKTLERDAALRKLTSPNTEVASLLPLPEEAIDAQILKAMDRSREEATLEEAIRSNEEQLTSAKTTQAKIAASAADVLKQWRDAIPGTNEGVALLKLKHSVMRESTRAAKGVSELERNRKELLAQLPAIAAAAETARGDLRRLQYVHELGALRISQQQFQRAVERAGQEHAIAQKHAEAAAAAFKQSDEKKSIKLPLVDVEVDTGVFLVVAPLLILAVFYYLEGELRGLRRHLSSFSHADRQLRVFSSLFTWGEDSAILSVCVFAACHLLAPATLLLLQLRATGTARAVSFVVFLVSAVPALMLVWPRLRPRPLRSAHDAVDLGGGI